MFCPAIIEFPSNFESNRLTHNPEHCHLPLRLCFQRSAHQVFLAQTSDITVEHAQNPFPFQADEGMTCFLPDKSNIPCSTLVSFLPLGHMNNLLDG